MKHTVETAPIDEPILVYVRNVDPISRKPRGWLMGKCFSWRGTRSLLADGYNGDWDIPYWHPLPGDPEATR